MPLGRGVIIYSWSVSNQVAEIRLAMGRLGPFLVLTD